MAHQCDPKPTLQVSKTKDCTTSFPLHSHAAWEILCYTENSGSLRLPMGASIPFEVGTVLMIPPHLPHSSRADSPFENICIVDPNFPETVITKLGNTTVCNGVICTHDNQDGDITALFRMIYRAYMEPDGIQHSHALITNLLNAVYELILRQIDASQDVCASAQELVRIHMLNHFSEPAYTVSDAFAACRVNPNTVRASFRRTLGVSPGEFLRSLRMKHAADLLTYAGDTMTVCEIALRCGYSDPLYFSKVFRSIYSMSPTEYRAALQASDNNSTKKEILS